ncbi:MULTISPECIES: hypothetical protein [unclassified Pseudomonas]|uniref:hypothetical protein n=1 Tax=unclassified Pseudomonas TaxID=196821 RepID=UPI000876BE0C|nr:MULTISPECIES: hypothetical protein [unclassified Pseudomonas]SCZ24006.1 hypothetical protein SAMN03159405_01074 [Pseudomonas sp. NFACC44-2]SDA67166.1 hypothetical protein SAMN03159429_02695 [Pseudomonas sp. NFACC51]SFJ20129.1 hypothetical protein SAMN03159302_05484 [Pseudomonas sp. NFACC54]SFS56932.1 hypothetical protein SAMN03159306_01191 [Pseudomonas sp. NFACC48-1]
MKHKLAFTALYISLFTPASWATPLATLGPDEKVVRNILVDEENMPTDPKLYTSAIGGAHFERSALRTQQGYTVESGYLRNDAKEEVGSMVLVRSPNGSVTAFVDEPNKRGLLEIDPNGKSKFTADTPHDPMAPDTVKGDVTDSRTSNVSSALTEGNTPKALSYADVLVAYGNAIYNKVSDPIAFALGQVETVNTALRKTGNNEIALRLAAITVFHNNTSVSQTGITSWQNFLAPYKSLLKTDLNVVFTGKGGSFWSRYEYGIAFTPGLTSLNAVLDDSTVLRHEVAHNAGAKHCGETNDYAQGYKGTRPLMDDFYSILCGNEYQGVYSNPHYTNFFGIVMGSATKGDTARVWRENTARIVNSNVEPSGLRLMLVGSRVAELRLSVPEGLAPYVVAQSQDNGPTTPIVSPNGEYTRLEAFVTAEGSTQRYMVRLRGTRANGGCAYRQMHYAYKCQSGANLHLRINYIDADNPDLPRNKHYTGFLPLIKKEWPDESQVPINVSIAVWR